MNMLMNSDHVQVKGSLARFRDLIYIDDVIQGWDKCLFGNAHNQSFNLGNGEKISFETLIHSLAKIMNKTDRLRIEELAGTPGDMMGCVADLTKIRSALKYEPKFKLDEGLEKMFT
jgi:nucleoside-diphosphate-sugar epimerase